MKTTINYFSVLLIAYTLVCTSCGKEELYEPIEVEKHQSTAFKTSHNTLDIALEVKSMGYDYLYPNKTVVFKNQLWYITQKSSPKPPYTFTNQIWSSQNGKKFILRSSDEVPTSHNLDLVSYNSKLWLIGNNGSTGVWSSNDGIAWSRVAILRTPFSNTSGSGVVVFNGKMFVFEKNAGGGQRVFSSTNGSFWHLENENAFPNIVQGKSIVFKNTLYYVGGFPDSATNPTNDIYKSTNGRDWSKSGGLVPYPNTAIFGPRSWFGMTLYEDKVWIIGGSSGGHTLPDNEIWHSSDMTHWTKYKGIIKFGWLTGHTAITFRDRIYLMGGFKEGEFFDAPASNKQIWSIRFKRGLYPH